MAAGSRPRGRGGPAGGQPSGDIEEVQLLDVGGQPSQLPGDRCEQGVPETGLVRDELAEPVAQQTTVSVALSAVALADRGAPSSRASSPKTSPGRRVARIASSPVSEGSEILTSPLTMTNRASPGSPTWKMTSPRRNRRDRMLAPAARARPGPGRRRTGSRPATPGPACRAASAHRSRERGRRMRVGQPTRRVTRRGGVAMGWRPCARPGRAPPPDRARLQHGGPAPGDADRGLPRRVGGPPSSFDPDRASSATSSGSSTTRPGRVVIGHMHADHYLDIVGLRYLYPWGEPARPPAGPPPARRSGSAGCAVQGRQRAGWVLRCGLRRRRVRPGRRPDRSGDLQAWFVHGRHTSRPGAWSSRRPTARASATPAIPAPRRRSRRPSATSTCCSSRAPPRPAHGDPERGHLTAEEALELARRAEARIAILVHYGPGAARRAGPPCARRGAVRSGPRRRASR